MEEPVLTPALHSPAALRQAESCHVVRGEWQDMDGDWAQGFITADPPPKFTRVRTRFKEPKSPFSFSSSVSPSQPSLFYSRHRSPHFASFSGSEGDCNNLRNCTKPNFNFVHDDDDCGVIFSSVKRAKGGEKGGSENEGEEGGENGGSFVSSIASNLAGRQSGEAWESSPPKYINDMTFNCQLCTEHYNLSLAYPMPNCTCIFCEFCLRKFIRNSLNKMALTILEDTKGNYQTRYNCLPCPSDTCPSLLPVLHCQDLAPSAFYRWESALSNALLQYESNNNNNFTNCPNCGVLVEMVPSEVPPSVALSGVPELDRTVPYIELDSNGIALSRHAMCHRLLHRYRCSICSNDFCGSCQKAPYHLGKTCEENDVEATAGRCLFCEEGRTRGKLSWVERSSTCSAEDDSSWILEERNKWSVHDLRRELERRKADSSWCVEKSDLWVVFRLTESVCEGSMCQKRLRQACTRVHGCGHPCGGVRGEARCLPCLQEPCRTKLLTVAANKKDNSGDLPSGNDFCPVCYVEPLNGAPCIQLSCGHILHRDCAEEKLRKGYVGPELSFSFLQCPLCAKEMQHLVLKPIMARLLKLKTKVYEMALERIKADSVLRSSPELRKGDDDARLQAFALRKLLFYECSRCREPYFGGDRQCGAPAVRVDPDQGKNQGGFRRFADRFFRMPQDRKNQEEPEINGNMEGNGPEPAEEINAQDLVCGPCIAKSAGSGKCKMGHEDKYIEFKCRFCCSVATYFCFGTTHFCSHCHATRPDVHKTPLQICPGPRDCPLKMAHLPNGQEFCLGCALCRLGGGVRPKRT